MMARKTTYKYATAAILGIGFAFGMPMTSTLQSQQAYAQMVLKQQPMMIDRNHVLTLSTARMTRFNPAVHGYRFVNTFLNVTGIANITTGGLCAGMVYSALDYYKAGTPIPQQTYTPVNGTTLQSYLYDRNMQALGSHIDKWIELHGNLFGARNSEFFKWGLQGTGGGRLQELRTKIDAGEPVPLGLKSLSANFGEDHVVLAYGYSMGRYTGDLGANQTDLKIFIYEPNFGAQKVTLVPKPDREMWCYEERDHNGNEKCWRTYFVQSNYGVRTAPLIPAGPQKEMRITLKTGGDDLRGGGDNTNVLVSLTRGRSVLVNNVNQSQRWIDGSVNTFGVSLPADATPNDVQSVQFQTAFRGGLDGDNWNIDNVDLSFRQDDNLIGRCRRTIAREGSMRLTAANRNATFDFPCGNQLHVFFRTGGDDLRGGNDNVSLTVSLRNGQELDFPNINQGRGWEGNSTTNLRLPLPSTIGPGDINRIQVKTNFGGGFGGDNWNLDAFHAFFIVNEVSAARCVTGNLEGGALLQRFTASDQKRDFAFPC